MVDSEKCSVFVLTDTPGIYGDDLNHRGVSPVFVKDVGGLLSKLKDQCMAGLVLEVGKVMNASRKERDRLFNYVDSFPVLRTKPNVRHGFATYLDPKDAFLHNLDAASGKLDRNHSRVHVNLDCAFALEGDPSMSQAVDAAIFDISPGGCFVHTAHPVEEHFIHLRIPSLSHNRPIYSSVRWTRSDCDPSLRGMGLMFIDLTDDQLEEIKQIKPVS